MEDKKKLKEEELDKVNGGFPNLLCGGGETADGGALPGSAEINLWGNEQVNQNIPCTP